MPVSTRTLIIAAGMGLWTAWPVAAQGVSPVEPPPTPEQAPAPEQDEAPTGMERPEAAPLRPVVAPRVDPVRPEQSGASVPGLEGQNFLVTRAPLRAEGTFLVRQPGSMVRLKTGEWVFVFHRATEGAAERPMVLIPSGTLSRMERVAQERGEEATFLVTGQVFVYQQLNYLLPTAYTVEMERRNEQAPPSAAGSAAAPGEGPAPAQEPGVEDLIRELETQRSRPRTISRREKLPTEEGGVAALRPEGEFLTRRRGRLVRLAGGEWALAFETDADSEASLDAPMVVAPSMNLQRMEAVAARLGESATFEVSGRVLAYGGRNYLVPTMFRAYPPSEVRPMQ